MALNFEDVLDAEDQIFIAEEMKTAWQQGREHRGNPVCHVMWATISGDRSYAGIDGTATYSYLIQNANCLFADLTKEEVENLGGMVLQTDKRVVMYDVQPPVNYMLYTNSTYWDIRSVNYWPHSGRCEMFAREKSRA